MIIEPQKSDREEARGRALVTHARRPPFPTSSTLSRKIRAPPPTPPPSEFPFLCSLTTPFCSQAARGSDWAVGGLCGCQCSLQSSRHCVLII